MEEQTDCWTRTRIIAAILTSSRPRRTMSRIHALMMNVNVRIVHSPSSSDICACVQVYVYMCVYVCVCMFDAVFILFVSMSLSPCYCRLLPLLHYPASKCVPRPISPIFFRWSWRLVAGCKWSAIGRTTVRPDRHGRRER